MRIKFQKLNGKWSKDSDELLRCTTCLNEQCLTVTSFQSVMREMKNEIATLHESIEKGFESFNSLMNSLQSPEVKEISRVDSNQVEHHERGRDVLKEIQGEQVMQFLPQSWLFFCNSQPHETHFLPWFPQQVLAPNFHL